MGTYWVSWERKKGIPAGVKLSILRTPMRFNTLHGAGGSMLPQCYFVATLLMFLYKIWPVKAKSVWECSPPWLHYKIH
jgi:hypothetical protein